MGFRELAKLTNEELGTIRIEDGSIVIYNTITTPQRVRAGISLSTADKLVILYGKRSLKVEHRRTHPPEDNLTPEDISTQLNDYFRGGK